MNFFKTLSLKTKIIVFSLLVTFITIFVGIIINFVADIGHLKSNLKNNNSDKIQLVSEYFILPIQYNYKDKAVDNLKMLTSIESIKSAYIFDVQGNIFASHSVDSLNNKIPDFVSYSYSYFDNNTLFMYEPIIYKGIKYGTIFIEVNTNLYDEVVILIIKNLIILVLMALLSLFLANKFEKYISKPIIHLAETTRLISENSNFNIKIEKQSNDEIGLLYDEFNNLLEIIKSKNNQRDKTELALKESESQSRFVFQNIPIGLVICSFNDDIIIDANPFCCKIYGYSYHEFIKLSLNDILGEKSNELFSVAKQMLRTGEHFTGISNIKNNKNENIFIEFNCSSFFYKGTENVLIMVEDITNKKKINDELIEAKYKAEESDKLKTAFLANMSHEIRTPINGILGYSELLKQQNLDNIKKDNYLNIISNSIKQLLVIIDDIIDISKIESNQIKLVNDKCNLRSLLNYVFNIISTEINNKNKSEIIIKLNPIDPEIAEFIIIDEVRLKQVLVNLLNNALKFTDKGIIEFGCDKLKNSNYLKFYVKDNGIGISEENIKIIFDRFRQADEDLTRNYGGTGLGLSISKNIVNLLNGEMWVDSKLGEGSTFYFTLPYNVSHNTEKTEEKPEENIDNETKDWGNKSILITEDDDTNFSLIYEILYDSKINIIRAKNGKEALEIFNENKFNLVLMDVQIPLINGLDVIKEIRKTDKITPIIALSAHALVEDAQKAKNAGANDYITKPVFINTFINTISKFLY